MILSFGPGSLPTSPSTVAISGVLDSMSGSWEPLALLANGLSLVPVSSPDPAPIGLTMSGVMLTSLPEPLVTSLALEAVLSLCVGAGQGGGLAVLPRLLHPLSSLEVTTHSEGMWREVSEAGSGGGEPELESIPADTCATQ